jgi:hypothetical protein
LTSHYSDFSLELLLTIEAGCVPGTQRDGSFVPQYRLAASAVLHARDLAEERIFAWAADGSAAGGHWVEAERQQPINGHGRWTGEVATAELRDRCAERARMPDGAGPADWWPVATASRPVNAK